MKKARRKDAPLKRYLFIAPILVLLAWVGKSGFSMLMADTYHHNVKGYL